MFILNDQVKDNVAEKTGLRVDQIVTMSSCTVNRQIEAKLNKKLPVGYPSDHKTARGSVYINNGRLIMPGETDKKLSRI